MKRVVLYIFFMLFFLTFVAEAQNKNNIAFKAGEKLTYVTTYKVGIINVDVADVVIHTTEDFVGLKKTYHVNALAKVDPDYTWFFNLRDEYDIWLDKETLRPLLFKNDIKEGTYRYHSTYRYDWKNMKVHTTERNLSWDEDRKHTNDLFDSSYDALSIFFNLRNKDVSDLKVGHVDTLKVVFADKINSLAFIYMGKEEKRVQGLGKVKTIKFTCQLANDSGVSFKDGTYFTIWLSDDKNRIPVYLHTPIRIGSVRVRLHEAKGLRNPTMLKFNNR